jgi:hypothetical protein
VIAPSRPISPPTRHAREATSANRVSFTPRNLRPREPPCPEQTTCYVNGRGPQSSAPRSRSPHGRSLNARSSPTAEPWSTCASGPPPAASSPSPEPGRPAPHLDRYAIPALLARPDATRTGAHPP